MTGSAGGRQPRHEEIWLRGNVRPLLAAAAGALLLGVLLLAVCALLGLAAWLLVLAAGVLAAFAIGSGLLAWAAAAPRLARAGDVAVVRLGPWRREEVPLEVIECFFLGSAVLGRRLIVGSCSGQSDDAGRHPEPAVDDDARRRRGTLVVRLAERARDFHERSSAMPWGGWGGGAIVFDGMWCEPLSPALVRELTGRLVAAKREVHA